MIAGHALSVWATGVNAFFSQVVRIQTERGHTVITDGPYRFVRHPAYAGSLLEDKTLQAELPGYAEYAQRVRYRLLPGAW